MQSRSAEARADVRARARLHPTRIVEATHMASTQGTVLDALKQRARDTPSAAAFVVDGERVSYSGLRRQAADLARRLSRIGLRRGERCLITLTSPLDTIRLCYACHMLAATPVVIDPWQWTLQRERRIRGSQPALVIADLPSRRNTPVGTRPLEIAFEFLQHVTPSPSSCLTTPAPDDAAYLQFTSTTMGEASAAVVSHRAWSPRSRGCCSVTRSRPGDIVAAHAPLHHSTGLVRYAFGAVWFGCAAHLLGPTAGHVAHWIELLASTRATVTSGPDFTFRVAAATRMPDPPRLDHLRMVTTGGEVFRASSIVDFERRFGLSHIVQPAYGLSEATLIVASADAGDALVTDARGTVSCGTAMPGVELRVVQPDGHDCPPGDEGRDPRAQRAVVRRVLPGSAGDRPGAARGLAAHRRHRRPRSSRTAVSPHTDASADQARRRGHRPSRDRRADRAPRPVAGVAAVGVSLPHRLTEDIVVIVETPADRADDIATLSTLVDITVRDSTGARPARVVLVRPGAIPRSGIGQARYLDLQEFVVDGRLRAATLHTT